MLHCIDELTIISKITILKKGDKRTVPLSLLTIHYKLESIKA